MKTSFFSWLILLSLLTFSNTCWAVLPTDQAIPDAPQGASAEDTASAEQQKTDLVQAKNTINNFLQNYSGPEGQLTRLKISEDQAYIDANTSRLASPFFIFPPGAHIDSSSFFSYSDNSMVIMDIHYEIDPNNSRRLITKLLLTATTKGADIADSATRWKDFNEKRKALEASSIAEKINTRLDDGEISESKTIAVKKADAPINPAALKNIDFSRISDFAMFFKPVTVSVQQTVSREKSSVLIPINGAPLKFLNEKEDDSSKNTNIPIETVIKTLNAMGFDLEALKNYIEAFQKLTTTITNEEQLKLRPFYEEVAKLIKDQLGIDLPEAPKLNPDGVSPEELEWRKKVDALVYKILLREASLTFKKENLPAFDSKFKELFKLYVLPVQESYNNKVRQSVLQFLQELKDLLANKTEQVVIKTTKQNVQFIIDITPSNTSKIS